MEGEPIISFGHVPGRELCLFVAVKYVLTWPGITSSPARFTVRLHHVTVGGIPIDEYCSDIGLPWNDKIRESIATKTKKMGSEIISTKGRTHYGIATCVCQLADAIINQRPTIASVSSVLMGEHGCRDVALSVPSVIGPAGVQQRIREKWAPEEYRGFFDAVENVRAVLSEIN